MLAIVSAFVGITILINREYYVWASSTSIALVITFYVLHMVPEDSDSLSVIIVFLSASFVGTSLVYMFLIKRSLRKILEEMNIVYSSVEVLSDKVSAYYRTKYHLKDPFAVRVVKEKKVTRGYFDVHLHLFVVENPFEFPVYSDTPTPVWEIVVEVHHNGAPKRVEFKDRNDKKVGITLYDERGSPVKGSWRLKKGSREEWNPVKREWELQLRRWH